ncbi:MAG: YigZ family protein [Campylobacterota bacterium]|nr:YigZ family protein [Campylobacterota bacterium]
MNYINQEYTHTLEIKKSKFIAHIVPYSQFNALMKRLKDQHPKARHFVYAYRYLNAFDQIVENSSDDGEPKGTSGKPSLKVLEGAKLINTAVIIVRYFGGTRLGTGGLVRAYGDAVNAVIQCSDLHVYKKLKTQYLHVEYTLLSKIEYMISLLDIDIIEKQFDIDVVLQLSATQKEYDNLSQQLPLGLCLSDA